MGLSFPSLPSLSDVRNSVAHTVGSVRDGVRDIGSAAVSRTVDLGRAGADLGRHAVDAVRSIDVREAATTVRGAIGRATEAGREGIKDGVEWTGQQVHRGADAARSHVTGNDIASRALRGAITAGETHTRFQLGVVGGVAREAVGLVGTVGQLGVTVAEMQVSREASADYSQRIAGAVQGAATATSAYTASVVADPSRVGRDLSGAADAGSDWVGGQISRYDQAIRDGRGPETIGMDVGTIATYLVPVGGGPARGAATALAHEGGETLLREGVEALVREGGETLARQGGEALAREGGEAVVRRGGQTIAREGGEAAARDAATAAAPTVPATVAAANATSAAGAVTDRGVYFFNESVLPYIDKADATLSRAGSSHFFMPVQDSRLVTDAASAYRYTGGAPSLERAYVDGLTVYGVDFPIAGLPTRLPTAADTTLPHFLEGGNTALRLGDGAGYLVNPTREFVTPGGVAMPAGSVLFRLEEGGARVQVRSW